MPLTEKQAEKALRAVFANNPDDAEAIIGAIGVAIKVRGVSKVAAEAALRRERLHKVFITGRTAKLKAIIKVLSVLGYRLKIERIPK